MRIVHVTAFDSLGGAGRTAYRLHAGLLARGVDSQMFVRVKDRDDPTVHAAASAADRVWPLLRDRLERIPRKLYRRRRNTPFTAALYGSTSIQQLAALRPRIVHLHWLGPAFVQLGDVRSLGVPVVWTLHDSWPFTGGCHVPPDCDRFRERCGRCPALGSAATRDLSRLGWLRKRRALRGLNLVAVTPSRWMAERARSSSLLGSTPVLVIPNGLDTDLFRPVDQAVARQVLRIPGGRPVLLYGAMYGNLDPNKGLDLLREALQRLPDHGVPAVRLLVLGSGRVPGLDLPHVEVQSLGIVTSDEMIVMALNAADAAVVPSRLENFPNAALEAAACGRPVAAFDTSGIPEIVRDGETGRLARAFDAADLARAIGDLLGDPAASRAMGERARRRAVEGHSIPAFVSPYAGLYERMMVEEVAAS